MANGDAFDDAVRLARETPSLDVGCHLVLVQGRSLVTGKLLPKNPRALLRDLALKRLNVYAELRAQVEKIMAQGIRPTHLDTHKHTHLVPSVFRQVVRLAFEFEIPYVRLPLDATLPFARVPAERFYRRNASRFGVRMPDHFLGFRLTDSFTERSFASALSQLQDGTTEFMCHPGYLGPELQGAATRLKESRVCELQALTSPRIRDLLDAEAIRLSPFGIGLE